MEIRAILEEKEVFEYLKKRNLVIQYKKAKQYLLEGSAQNTNLKKRQPKKDGVYYFRINRQYRAIGYFREEGVLVIVEVDDHQ